MKTNTVKEFNITITCNETEAKVLSDALHNTYKEMRTEYGYDDDRVIALRTARNAFAGAIDRHFMGEDA